MIVRVGRSAVVVVRVMAGAVSMLVTMGAFFAMLMIVGFFAVMMMMVSVPMIVTVAVFMLMSMMMLMVMVMMMIVPVIMVMMMIMVVMMTVPMMVPVIVIVMMMMMMMMMLVRMNVLGVNKLMSRRPLRHIRIGRADDDAQHVRPVRQVARTGSVADRFDDHLRQSGGEAACESRYDAGAGRRRHLHLVVGLRDRQPAHHLERGRRRDRIQAVIAAHRSRSERHGGAVYVIGIERIERERDADHVDDRIDRADFVKMHLFERNAVNFAFGDADFFENGQAVRCNPLVKAGGFDHPHDVRIMAMMRRRLVRIEHDVHFQSGNAFFVHPFPFQRERFDANFLQLGFDVSPVGARIDERGQRHVAANARETIEIDDSHVDLTTFSTYFC